MTQVTKLLSPCGRPRQSSQFSASAWSSPNYSVYLGVNQQTGAFCMGVNHWNRGIFPLPTCLSASQVITFNKAKSRSRHLAQQLNYHIELWHPISTSLIWVLPPPFLIQLPAKVYTVEGSRRWSSTWVLALIWETWTEFQAPGFDTGLIMVIAGIWKVNQHTRTLSFSDKHKFWKNNHFLSMLKQQGFLKILTYPG